MTRRSPLFDGATVRRVDVGDGVAAIEVRLPGETAVLIVAITARARGVGIVSNDDRRAAWGGRLPAGAVSRQGPRALLEGGQVVAIGPRGVTIACRSRSGEDKDLPSEREDKLRILGIEGPRVQLFPDGAVPAPDGGPYNDDERATLEALGATLLREVATGAIVRRRDDVARAIGRAIAKLERRAKALGGDLARIGDADEMARRAQWLVAAASRAPRGARSLSVRVWGVRTGGAGDQSEGSDEERVLEVPLDPARSAKEQVEAMFHKARRLKRGGIIAGERLAQAESMSVRLRAIVAEVQGASTLPALEELFVAARAVAPRDVPAGDPGTGVPGASGVPARGKMQPKSVPYRAFLSSSGTRLLVGKGAAQNDALTFQIARPHDLWLHVKDHAGAHVLVPLAKNRECPPDVLIDAAHLAAHFSDARGEGITDVQYVARKYLRKPKGGAPGLVVVDREKVIAVRIEPARMKALLEAEETSG